MPILVKSDDIKWKKGQGLSRPVTTGAGVIGLILGRSETQYVAMVTKLLSSNCGAHLVESYCKEVRYKLAEVSFFCHF